MLTSLCPHCWEVTQYHFAFTVGTVSASACFGRYTACCSAPRVQKIENFCLIGPDNLFMPFSKLQVCCHMSFIQRSCHSGKKKEKKIDLWCAAADTTVDPTKSGTCTWLKTTQWSHFSCYKWTNESRNLNSQLMFKVRIQTCTDDLGKRIVRAWS